MGGAGCGGRRSGGQDQRHGLTAQHLAQPVQRRAALLPARPPGGHQHRLRVRPGPGAVAAPDLAQDHAEADRQLGSPVAGRCGFRRGGRRSPGRRGVTAPRGLRRSVREQGAGDGPWCQTLVQACGRAFEGRAWGVPWRRDRPGACRRVGLLRVARGENRSPLADG